MADDNGERLDNDENAFWFAIGGTALLGVIAFIIAWFTNLDINAMTDFNANAVALGVIYTTPLVIFLWWFATTDVRLFANFRDDQLKFFMLLPFPLTPWRIATIAVAAGVFEELLFRGVFQTTVQNWIGPAAALILSSLIFGALHWRTTLYAAITTVIGLYLGAVFLWTENLLVPIIVHGLYDAIALHYTATMLKQRR